MNLDSLVAGIRFEGVSIATADGSTPLSNAFPAESDLVAASVPGRRREFLLGRQLLRRLFAERGCRVGSIGAAGPGGVRLPVGYAGSISHSRGLIVTAIASNREYMRLGIDIELGWVAADVAEHLGLAGPDLGRGYGRSPDEILSHKIDFSVREAVYKCLPAHLQESRSLGSLKLVYRGPSFALSPAALQSVPSSDRALLEDISGRWNMADQAVAALAVIRSPVLSTHVQHEAARVAH